MARRRPGRLLTLLGVFTIVVGVVGALVLVGAAVQRQTNAVEGFARAPVGCDTTLDFVEPGEYLVFVERAGSIESVIGNCDVESTYDIEGDIGVVVTVVDPAGEDLALDRVIGTVDYDVAGFIGEAAFTVDIAVAGDHVMRVESDDGFFAAAVGRDPGDGLGALIAAAGVAAVAGLVVGLGMILAGRSRRANAAVQFVPSGPPGAPFSPVGQVPQGPPTYTQPGGPVNYGHPPDAGARPASPPWQPAPPAPPPGMPRYQPPPPPSPPAPTPPAPTPQIPGEPTWVPPGTQPPPPVAVPIPPGAGERPELGSDAPTVRLGDFDDGTLHDDATIRRDDVHGSDRSKTDGVPTTERSPWDQPPAPN